MTDLIKPQSTGIPPNGICINRNIPVAIMTQDKLGRPVATGQMLSVECMREACPRWIKSRKHSKDPSVAARHADEPDMCATVAAVYAQREMADELASQTFLSRLPEES